MGLACLNSVHCVLAAVSLASIASAATPTDWFLMGRHGECAPMASLVRKGPEFRGLQTPYELIDKMRSNGHWVDVKEHVTPHGTMIEVNVPAKGIAVIVVPAALCKKTSVIGNFHVALSRG